MIRRCGLVEASRIGSTTCELTACALSRSPPTASASPIRGPSGSTRPSSRPGGAYSSLTSRTSNPAERSTAKSSASGRWNSLVPSSSQSIRSRPRWGRCNVSCQPSSAAQSIDRVELRRNTSSPPGRSSRAASGIQRRASHQIEAPYSESARSNEASGSGTSSAFASSRGNSIPGLLLQPPRRLQLRRRDVDADRARAAAREPGGEVRGAAAELDDVLAGHVGEDAQLGLGNPPEPPADLLCAPGSNPVLVRVLRVRPSPALAVADRVLGQLRRAHRRRTRARSRARPTRASRSRG